MILPFLLLLGSIALTPLFALDWWSKHYPKVAIGLGAVTLGYYLLWLRAFARVLHGGHEYISFITLIGALFVVSGGIHINVKGEATPRVNTIFLLIGALVSNLLGTTGASMLLIRPWIRMNKYRVTAHHIVFFIFIVSNVGGCLTPIGDPPLFLGYLKGIPFWWVAAHCWLPWLTAVGVLLGIFFLLDRANYRRAPRAVRSELAEAPDEWRFEGLGNLVWLAVVIGAVFIKQPPFLREGLMLAAATASYFLTKKEIHVANHFHFHPIEEVAILFLGIFTTMMPALDWLQIHAGSWSNLSPAVFYWASGSLSSFLDNAPTYLAFFSAALGMFFPGAEVDTRAFLANPEFNRFIVAISIGAVFFGANTYIGNGPNFMVKAIADHQKVHTPGFLGFVFHYTLPYMLPMLVLVWFLFLRG